MKLDRQWVAVDDLVADLRQIACSLLAHHGRRLVVLSSARRVDLLTDPLAVRCILRALLVEAVRSSGRGNVALRITGDPYAARFSIEACEADGGGSSGISGGFFPTLDQAERLARLLGGDVVAFETDGGRRNLSFILPHSDAVGRSLLRAAAAGPGGTAVETAAL